MGYGRSQFPHRLRARNVSKFVLRIPQSLLRAPSVFEAGGESHRAEALDEELDAGRVDTLVVLEANPVYAAPSDRRFAERMRRAPTRIHLGLYRDETARESTWT